MLLRRRALWACLFLSISCFLARIVVLGSRLGLFAVSHDVNLDSPDAMDNARGLITGSSYYKNATSIRRTGAEDIYHREHGFKTMAHQEKRTDESIPPTGHKTDATILKTLETSWLSASNHSLLVNETIQGQDVLVSIRAGNWGKIRPLKEIKRKLLANNTPLQNSILPSIERIYYINLDRRGQRRAIMESWLSKQTIPYQRVPALEGEATECAKRKQGGRCIGVSGLIKTSLHIMDNLNTTGMTLVVEDDFVIRDMEKLLNSIWLVPSDWDILRWDCWDKPQPHFQRYPFSFKIGPRNRTACREAQRKQCWFCGGTHVALWKGGDSLRNLRRVWDVQPDNGIDCQLQDPSINAYCIQIGVGEFHFPLTERSDVSQVDRRPRMD